jgi:NADH:ubiquinone reductase (non-electrogenic)
MKVKLSPKMHRLCIFCPQDKVLDVQPEQLLRDGGTATGGEIRLASGTTLPYDWLVVALGASADARGIPGVQENARPFNTLADTEYVAGRLAAFEARAALGQQQQATVMIVGAGYAGIELAAVVAERLQGKASVVVVTPGAGILESAPAGQRQAAEEVGLWRVLCRSLKL